MKVYICKTNQWYTNPDFGTDPGIDIEKVFSSEEKAKEWVEKTREEYINDSIWYLEDLDDPDMLLTDGMTMIDIYYDEYDVE